MGFFGGLIAGAVTGIITGFGIGGGTLLILYLTMFGGISQLEAQGINLLYFIPTAGGALISHIKNKRVNFRAVIFSGIAGILVAVFSSIIASKMDITLLRRIFGIFLVFVGISELFAKEQKNSNAK